MVLTYSVHKNGAGLFRESQDIIAPGDYGLYTIGTGDPALYFFFHPVQPFSTMEAVVKENSPLLSVKVLHVVGCSIHDIHRTILFEGSESLNNGTPLKSHLTLLDGPHQPSDWFLRLHFSRCLAVSVCRGDVMEDYKE